MQGIDLQSLPLELCYVTPEYEKTPDHTIDSQARLAAVREDIDERWCDFSFPRDSHWLSLDVLSAFSFGELCMMRYGQMLSLHRSVEQLFREQPQYAVFHKVCSSLWRWSFSRGTWNEVAEAYNGLRRLRYTDVPGFELRLDHTPGYNAFGYSQYGRVYLDGVFGCLVHYKGTHVATIGFSFADERRVLLQQVQLQSRHGNRWLYKLPHNRVEHALDMLNAAFPRHTLLVVNGKALAEKNLRGYRTSRAQTEELRLDYLARAQKKRVSAADKAQSADDSERCAREIVELDRRIAHLKADKARLEQLYAETGQYKQGAACVLNGLTHHHVARPVYAQAA